MVDIFLKKMRYFVVALVRRLCFRLQKPNTGLNWGSQRWLKVICELEFSDASLPDRPKGPL